LRRRCAARPLRCVTSVTRHCRALPQDAQAAAPAGTTAQDVAAAAAEAPLAGGAPASHADGERARVAAAPDFDDDLLTPAPSPTAALQPPDSPDEVPDDAAVARRWLRRSDLAPLRDRPDFGVLIAGFFVRVQLPGVAGPPLHALLQIRSVRYRSRAYELLTARAARGGRPEYAFQELELEDDSVVTLNSVSNRPLGAPEVAKLRARVDAGQLRWPSGSRAARAALDAAAAALTAEREARAAARLEAKAEAAAAAAAAPPEAEPHPDTGFDEYGQMDVGAVLSKLNADDAPLLPPALEPALVARVEAPAPAPALLPQPSPSVRRSPAWDVAQPPAPCAVMENAPAREGSLPLWVPPPIAAAAPAPPPASARRQSRWDTTSLPPPPPPPRPTRDRTASPEALPLRLPLQLPLPPPRMDPYGGADPAALPPPPREWHRHSGERSPSRRRSPSPRRFGSRSPPRVRQRSPSPRWRSSRSRSRSPTRYSGRDARERSRERAYARDEQKAAGVAAQQWVPGSAEPVRSPPTARQKPMYPVYGSGKIRHYQDWKNPTAEMLARDAIIKAQRAAGECIDPTLKFV